MLELLLSKQIDKPEIGSPSYSTHLASPILEPDSLKGLAMALLRRSNSGGKSNIDYDSFTHLLSVYLVSFLSVP